MQALRRQPIFLRHRFFLTMGAMLALFIATAVYVLISLRTASRETQGALSTIGEEFSSGIDSLEHVQDSLQRARTAAIMYALEGDPEDRIRFDQLSDQVSTLLNKMLDRHPADAQQAALLRSALVQWQRVRATFEEIAQMPLPERGTSSGKLKRLEEETQRVLDRIEKLEKFDHHEVIRELNGARSAVDRTMAALGLSFGVALAGMVFLGRRLLQIQAKTEELSTTDALTGLYNRRAWQYQLETEVGRSRRYRSPMSLLMVDIDHFKVVNDTYGHQAGDLALRAVADVIRKELRAVDVIGRYGGEEFAVFLPETAGATALNVAERLRLGIAAHPIKLGPGVTVNLTVSVGVATLLEDVESAGALIAVADEALYAAKRSGRNRSVRGRVEENQC